MAELHALPTRPTIEDEVRASVIDTLEKALASAKAGEIADVIVIAHETTGDWRHLASSTLSVREQIGALELMKMERGLNHLNGGWEL